MSGPVIHGTLAIEPPLNEHEVAYLRRFAGTRRMNRQKGPYYTGQGFFGSDREDDVIDYNRPPPEQPELWCQWRPTEDGTALEWDRGEKFFTYEEWLAYLVHTFLRPGASLQEELASPVEGRYYPPEFDHFTFDHAINGVIDAVDAYEHRRLIVNYDATGPGA